MNRTILLAAIALSLGVALPDSAFAQTAKDLVGTWMNVSNVNIRQDGSKVELFGPHGTGIAIFESNGHYAIINMNPDVPKFASNNRATGTADENKAVVAGSNAFFGTYSLNEADKTLTLRIEGSAYPNLEGTQQKRTITSLTAGDELTWTNPATHGEVAWKWMK